MVFELQWVAKELKHLRVINIKKNKLNSINSTLIKLFYFIEINKE